MRNFLVHFSVAAMLMVVAIPPARADVCVWRNPERTMTRFFPQAADYITLTVKVTADHVAAMERALGSSLDPSETHEMNFYRITDRAGAPLGTVMALAGKGEYGAIEVVIGLEPHGKVIGAYIQQSRERVTKALRSPDFLSQFVGKTTADGLDVGQDVNPASTDAEAPSRVVALVIKKMLVFYDVLRAGDS